MENTFYLLSYTVNGIKNIDKDVTFDFYKKTIDENFDSRNYNVKAIYGENGTGKSAIINSVKILKNLMLNRYYLTDSNNTIVLNGLINKKTKKLKIELEYLFINNKTINLYKYLIQIEYNELSNRFVICDEELRARSSYKNSWKAIYIIENGELINCADSGLFKKLNDGNGSDTLKEQSFISNFFNKNFIKLIEESGNSDINNKGGNMITSLIHSVLFANSVYVYLDDKDKYDNYVIDTILEEYFKLKDKPKELPKISRASISDSYIDGSDIFVSKKYIKEFEKDVDGIYEFIKIFKPELQKIKILKYEDKDRIKCDLIFSYLDYDVSYVFESNGVKKLVNLYKALSAVDEGSIVFIDEFDSNIHDVYLCRLVEYIENYAKGQLCFTTQSITVMHSLEGRKKAIDFLCRDCDVVSWTSNSHYTPSKSYREGFVKKSPFNIESFDFLKAFGAGIDE